MEENNIKNGKIAEKKTANTKGSHKRRRRKIFVLLALLMCLAAELYVILNSAASNDSRFIRALNRGINNGLMQEGREADIRDMEAEGNLDFISAEYQEVKEFIDRDFEDDSLEEVAHEYIEALADCSKAIENKNPKKDYSSFWTAFSEPYGRRLLALYELKHGDYGLEITGDDAQSEFDEILLQGWAIKKTGEIVFGHSESEDGEPELKAILTNDSGYDLEYIDVSVDLFTEDNGKIGTVSAYAESIKSGEVFELTCYDNSNDIEDDDDTDGADAADNDNDSDAGAATAKFVITSVNCAMKNNK